MSELSNVFSVLNLDAEDDKEQTSCLTTVSAIDECSSRIYFLNLDAEDDKEQTSCLTTVSAIDECSSRISGDGDNQDFEVSMKRAHSDSYKSHNNIHPSWLPSVSGSYKLPLVWIDLEMTGLEIEVDRILEIACIITDGKLIKSVEGPDLVIKQSKECLDNMGEWCREHHSASGLTERVLQSTITEKDAEEQVINFVRNHVGAQAPLLAGNSVYVDFMFLKKYMPCLASIFPHVLVDVSSITALCMRWFPKEKKAAPTKEKKHRAMDDIKESIRELKYYKESIFKGFRKSK